MNLDFCNHIFVSAVRFGMSFVLQNGRAHATEAKSSSLAFAIVTATIEAGERETAKKLCTPKVQVGEHPHIMHFTSSDRVTN